MKKIGLLLDDTLDTPDGVQQYVLTLGRWLESQGHEVHYIVGASKRQDIKNMHSLARVVRITFNGNKVGTPLLASKRRIKSLIKKLELDVVHVQMPYSPLFAGRFINALPQSTKVVGSLHVLPRDRATLVGARMLKVLLGKSLPRIDTILSNTVSTQHFFKTTWGVESQVIPNPVNVAAFKTDHTFEWNARKVNIVFLGRMVERKGALNLVKAIGLLPTNITKKTMFYLGGKGPLLEKVEASITLHGMDHFVKTLGFISEEDKPGFLKSADIAIFPSIGGESFGISLIEAMAAGSRVVLAGHNPGYDCVLGVRSDLMFDASDPQSIADSIEKWVNAPKERQQTHKWLQNYVDQFDIQSTVGPQIVKIYNS